MHGEKVGFGIITQLCLDDEGDWDEKLMVIDWLIEVGLPVTFADLSLADVTREKLSPIGEGCAAPGSLSHNHPFKVTARAVIDAMIAADALGRRRKEL